jgi:hypothetical protein
MDSIRPRFAQDTSPDVKADRRTCPDRRAAWRGGRRQADWVNRPIGALLQFSPLPRRMTLWRQWFSTHRAG